VSAREPHLELPQIGTLTRPGAKPDLRLVDLPPWHGWRTTNEAARARRWVEGHLSVPTGANAGQPFRFAGFQRELVRLVYDSLAAFVSMPAANGKTTLLAALALERICRGDPYAHVDVVATKEDQAAMLIAAAVQMVERCPALVRDGHPGGPLVAWHARDGVLEYRPSGARLQAHPAKLSAVQGLNFTLAIVDEVGFARDEIVEALIARLGKRPDAHLVGIGTPGFEPNVLQRIRAASLDDELPAGVRYLEHSARPGCEVLDKAAWRDANPALRAGFLTPGALEVQAGLLSEREFRAYHLGQWVDADGGGFLPEGAWADCPHAEPPPDRTQVVLAVEGTYRRTLAVVGCTLEGAVFFGWAGEGARDEQLRDVLNRAADQYDVLEVVRSRRIRPALFDELERAGLPVAVWDTSTDNDATSANEFYRAVVDGRVAHDHDELLAQHLERVRVRWSVDGSLRLARPEGAWADAAFAARAAWYRAAQLAERDLDAAPVIY
jgi:phage terminase large subunit-like protein